MIETYITPAILAALILSAEVDAQSGIRPVWIAGPPEEVKKLRGVVEVVEGTVVQGYLEIPPWSTRNPEYGFTAHFINKTNAILGRIQIKIAFVDSTGEVIYTQSGHPDWIQPDEGPEWDPGEIVSFSTRFGLQNFSSAELVALRSAGFQAFIYCLEVRFSDPTSVEKASWARVKRLLSRERPPGPPGTRAVEPR